VEHRGCAVNEQACVDDIGQKMSPLGHSSEPDQGTNGKGGHSDAAPQAPVR
jgi:hypothetical protein